MNVCKKSRECGLAESVKIHNRMYREEYLYHCVDRRHCLLLASLDPIQ